MAELKISIEHAATLDSLIYMNHNQSERNPELQNRINKALQACNEMFARELGAKPRKHRKAKVQVTPNSPKLKALNEYRKQHPQASLREAAVAAGFNVKP